MPQPIALILFTTGTNRDLDVAQALEQAGACAEIVPLNRLRAGERRWQDYQLLVIPGGFSYADALGAGKLLALDLEAYFSDNVNEFISKGKPVIGICNGFQALVKANILPARSQNRTYPSATLTFNESGHFECRWVNLKPISKKCVWTHDLHEMIYCPVAHGEGKFVTGSAEIHTGLNQNDQIALIYSTSEGHPAQGMYPQNPNGSTADIAGVCNPQGNVLGLMPHPENHIFPHQHPGWSRGDTRYSGLPLFINGVRYAAQISS